MQFVYKSRAGSTRLTVDSYAYQPKKGTLQAKGIALFDETGTPIARLQSLDVVGLQLFGTAASGIRVVASGLEADVVRSAAGAFQFLNYLPEQKQSSTPTPFRVELKSARVRLIDLAGKGRWIQPVTVRRLLVVGLGSDYVASCDWTAPNIGAGQSEIRHSSIGDLTIQLRTPGFDLGPTFDHFRTAPELRDVAFLKDVTARSLTASGPATLFIPAGKPAEVVGKIDVVANRLRVADWVDADTARFVGSVSKSGAIGVLTARAASTTAQLNGAITWQNGVRIDGKLDAKVANLAGLPSRLARLLPKPLKFDAAVGSGQLRIQGSRSVWFSGQTSFAEFDWNKERATNVSAVVTASGDGASVEIRNASYCGSDVAGELSTNAKTRAISGWAKTPRASLAVLARDAGIAGLGGTTSIDVVVKGTLDSPVASIRALGAASYMAKNGRFFDLGAMTLAAKLEARQLTIQRLTLIGLAGALEATGSADINRRRLHVSVAGRDLAISEALPNWTGTAVVDGTVDGTFDQPHMSGHAEGYGIGTQDQYAPVSTVDFLVDRDHVAAEQFRVAKGSAFASGNLGMRFSDRSLTGKFAAFGIQLTDLLGPDVFGFADVKDAVVAGTLDRPQVSGTLLSDTIVAHGVKIDKTVVSAHLVGKQAVVDNAVVTAAGGTLTASGAYDIESHTGKLGFKGTPMALADLFSDTASDAALAGQVSGSGTFAIDAKNHVTGNSHVVVSAVQLNGTSMGRGYADIVANGSLLTGSAQIGSLDRYLEVPSFAYEIDKRTIDGEFVVYNYLLKDLYSSTARYLPPIDPQLSYKLDALGGSLNADVLVSGDRSKPDVDLKVMDATGLEFGGVEFGELHGVATRKGAKWDVASLKYLDGAATIQASGSIVENGNVALKGVVNGIEMSKLSAIVPGLAGLGGQANSAFAVTGATASPVFRATLDSHNLSYLPPGGSQEPLIGAVNLDTITASETKLDGSGGIAFEGGFEYRGLLGTISGSAPLTFPLEIPRNRPVTANIQLLSRKFSTLTERPIDANPNTAPIPLIPGVDLKNTDGTIEGKVGITGTLDDLHVSGNVAARAKKLVLEGSGQTWNDASANAVLSDRKLALDFSGTSLKGGSAKASAVASIQSLGDLIDAVRLNGASTLLDDPVVGSIEVKSLKVDQALDGGGRVAGTADATVAIGGTLRAPSFDGSIAIGHGDVTVPGTPFAIGNGPAQTINPRFALKFGLSDPMRLRTSTSDFSITGGGTVDGRLSRPTIASTFVVESGSIRLPTARVRIDPRGTIVVGYQVLPTGVGQARANLNLTGRTQLTARETDSDYGGLVQRYAITLGITGDLLQEGGLNLSATSDPPGLAQDRILGLLGQSDLFAVLGTNLNKDEATRRVRDALSGYALPVVLDPVTSKLAAGLGLDYLSVEYNSFEQATFDFAKSLGAGFVFEGRRQLSQPLPGIKSLYDFRLTYHLRTKAKVLNRIAFGIGADQDHPWKLSVEYDTRF